MKIYKKYFLIIIIISFFFLSYLIYRILNKQNMNMNITIQNWNDPIPLQYICSKHQGNNISPSISWNKVPNAVSYALILQDISAHDYIHWYIPCISPNLTSIPSSTHSINLNNNISTNKLNQLLNKYYSENNTPILQGINSKGTIGYTGPCPPEGTGKHEYIFYIMALDGDLCHNMKNKNKNKNKIFETHTYQQFKTLLNENGINIIAEKQHSGFFQAP